MDRDYCSIRSEGTRGILIEVSLNKCCLGELRESLLEVSWNIRQFASDSIAWCLVIRIYRFLSGTSKGVQVFFPREPVKVNYIYQICSIKNFSILSFFSLLFFPALSREPASFFNFFRLKSISFLNPFISFC